MHNGQKRRPRSLYMLAYMDLTISVTTRRPASTSASAIAAAYRRADLMRAAVSSETSAVMSCRQLSDRVPFGSDPAVFQVEDNENEHRAGDHLLEPLRFL